MQEPEDTYPQGIQGHCAKRQVLHGMVPGFAAAWALFLAGLSFYNHRVEKNKKQDDDKQDKEG